MDRRKFVAAALTSVSAWKYGPGGSVAASDGRKWRYGVIGSGTRGRGDHLPILRDYFPQVEIVALCDITPENLERGLKLCGGSTKGYVDYRRMLDEHPELDAVVVCIPNFLHADVVV